jgi:hypothetical protein
MGAATVPEILSDLTWALGNNLFGWLGMEATVNFWYEVFTGSLRFRPLSAKSGSFGVDLGGLMAELVPNPVWTFQHTVWAKPNTFESLQAARVFVPSADFTPTLYASVIRVAPASGPAYLLDGPRDPAGAAANRSGPRGWTRAGGTAVPVVLGSPLPIFPGGGLHADAPIPSVTSPQAARGTELLPSGRLLTGRVTAGQVAVVLPDPATAAGLGLGDQVLLTDTSPGTAAPVVAGVAALPASGGLTRAVLTGAEALSSAAATTRVRLRRLALSRNETDRAVAGHPDLLDASAAPGAYPSGAPLRLSQSGAVVGSVIANGLSASLTLAGPATPALTGPITVYAADEGGAPTTVTLTPPSTLAYPAGTTAPGVGEFLAVRGTTGDPVVAAVVTAPAAGSITVDVDLTALTAPLNARPIASGVRLGLAAGGPDSAQALAYVPDAPARAATAHYVRLEPAGGPVTCRRVASVGFDAVAVAPGLPGNVGSSYDVEVFGFAGPDVADLALEVVSGVTLSPTDALADAKALALVSLAGAPPTAGAPLFAGGTVSGSIATFPPAGNRPAGVMLPLVVLAKPTGGTPAPALITAVRLTVALDRPLSLSPSALQAVLLTKTGPTYDADRIDATTVTVLPTVGRTAAATGASTQMPRFNVGEFVALSWPGGPATTSTYRVTAVDGTTLTLADGDAVPAGVLVTATRLVPGDPGTGHFRVGTNGATAGPDAVGRPQVAFDVWQPTHLPDSTAAVPTWIGIIDGADCRPAGVVATNLVAVTLDPPPAGGGGGIDILQPTFRTVTAGGGRVAWLADVITTATGVQAPGFTAAVSADTVVAVPFKETPVAVDGSLSSGTVLSPSDPENLELDRFDALCEHELWHTVQSSEWGNALGGFLPIGLLETVAAALNPNVELPSFSRYLSATLAGTTLTVADLSGVPVIRGDTLQIGTASAGAAPATSVEVTVAGVGASAGTFTVNRDLGVADGPVSVRRKTPAAWVGTLDSVLRTLTFGGLLNLTTVNLYEGLGYLIAHGIYWIERKSGHSDSGQAATVADSGSTLTLADDAGAVTLRSAQRVLIRQGDTVLTRTVSSADGRALHLQSPVQLTGDVQVFPYSTRLPGSTWDWHDYFPASVADPTRPAALTLAAADGRTLTLAVRDEIVVSYDTAPGGGSTNGAAGDGTRPAPISGSKRTSVVALGDAGIVEVADPPPLGADGLRVARIDAGDPMGNFDSALSTEMGLGQLTRWVTDPYGQLQVLASGNRGSFADVLGRIGRTLFSTRAFMLPVGWWLYDNAGRQLSGTAYNSSMEQGASERSGDTYNAIGRLRPDGNGPATVGDVYRYWLTDNGGNRQTGSFVLKTRGDAPGVWLGASTSPLLMPDRTPETGTAPVPAGGPPSPNLGSTAGAASGDAVPHTMYVPPSAVPGGPAAGAGFPPLARGWIPSSATLERTAGMYVAFTRPPAASGKHRVTASDNESYWATGRLAQNGGSSTVVYDVAPAPVVVTAGGKTIADGDSLTMIPTQRLTVLVTPDGARTYALLVQRPAAGTVLRTDGDLTLVAGALAGTEPVEVERRYRRAADGTLTDATLALHGLHLPGDLDIPVSHFTVTVATTLQLLATADPAGTPVTEMRPGDQAFLLVPAAVAVPTRVDTTTPVGSPAPPPAPGAAPAGVVLAVAPTPAELAGYLGPGILLQLTAPADAPPEEQTDVTLATLVGDASAPTRVASAVRLTPWFRVLAPAGAADWSVGRGTTVTLGLSDGVVAGAATLQPPDGVTVTVGAGGVTLAVEAGAAVGLRVLTATDSAQAAHGARRSVLVV